MYYFALIFLAHGALAVQCPADWMSPPDETSCYLLQDDFKTWQESRELCREKGGDLLVVNSDSEWDWIVSKLYPTLLGFEMSWFVGLRAVYEETSPRVGGYKWKWIDGRDFESSPSLKWGVGQPSGMYVTSYCGFAMVYRANIVAVNTICAVGYSSVCEKGKEIRHDSCPGNWLNREGSTSCYYMETTHQTTWFKARERCKASGGDLVSVNSHEEKEWLREEMRYYSTNEYWIGLSKNNLPKEWEWTDGTSHDSSILEWAQDLVIEGNNYPKSFEGHAHFGVYIPAHHVFITVPHFARLPSVCEITGVPYRIACEAPPPHPMEEKEMSCHAPSGREVQCHDVLHSEGTMAVYRCREPFQSTTGIPLAYSVCDKNQNWAPLPGFQCVLPIE